MLELILLLSKTCLTIFDCSFVEGTSDGISIEVDSDADTSTATSAEMGWVADISADDP